MLWRKLETSEQGMWCATQGCWGIPTQYMEASGVGSKYCSGCRTHIEATEDQQRAHEASVLPQNQ